MLKICARRLLQKIPYGDQNEYHSPYNISANSENIFKKINQWTNELSGDRARAFGAERSNFCMARSDPTIKIVSSSKGISLNFSANRGSIITDFVMRGIWANM